MCDGTDNDKRTRDVTVATAYECAQSVYYEGGPQYTQFYFRKDTGLCRGLEYSLCELGMGNDNAWNVYTVNSNPCLYSIEDYCKFSPHELHEGVVKRDVDRTKTCFVERRGNV